jgi:hypothetical protein
VVLFDIRRRLNIRLDPQTTATKFISDFCDCLQHLRKNNAWLSDDNDTMQTLLLVAIQDDDFELVRDSIVCKPDSSVESIFTELRERETSLMMKDQASNLSGDGNSNPRYSRWTQMSNPRSGSTMQQPGRNQSQGKRYRLSPHIEPVIFFTCTDILEVPFTGTVHHGTVIISTGTRYFILYRYTLKGMAGSKGGHKIGTVLPGTSTRTL